MNEIDAAGSIEPTHSAALLAAIVESAPAAVIVSDRRGNIRLVNREAELIFRYARAELLGQQVDMLVPMPSQATHATVRAKFFDNPTARGMGTGRELFGLRKDGTRVPIEIALTPIEFEGSVLVLSVIVDITERKRLQAIIHRANEELERRVRERTLALEHANSEKELLLADLRAQRVELDRLSREDSLTHLANRREFDQRLEAEIQRAQRQSTSLAVAMLDLDHFKDVNDHFGHAVGDAVLREVGNLIRRECRVIDVVSRYGGEEFALALPGSDLQAGVILCERIRVAFEKFDWNTLHDGLAVTVSAGVSLWYPGLDAGHLMAKADINLYEAKRLGRNRTVPPAD